MNNSKIKFNEFYYSEKYAESTKFLASDYEHFRNRVFSKKCLDLLKEEYPKSELYLTHSATAALEIIALLLDLKEGDEVILPSFTHVSTANAFVLRGAKPIFVDIELSTLAIDPELVKKAISENTKAIIAMHYGGVPCKIDELRQVANSNEIPLIEDAATGFGSKHHAKPLGEFGDLSAISFDITKHISAVQGGLLIVNNEKYIEQANKIFHCGTNRIAFEKEETPYFEWVSKGSKFSISENCSAILYEQLLSKESILDKRKAIIERYSAKLKSYNFFPNTTLQYNGHLFAMFCKNKDERDRLIQFLAKQGIQSLFHYIPLHSSAFGRKNCSYISKDDYTTQISNMMVRLPLHSKLNNEDVDYIAESIKYFYN